MRRPRFTIGSLLVFVLFLAVSLAALRMATEPWDSVVLGLTLLMLLGSVLLAIHRDGSRRAYWLGFALFGWAYLALLEIPSIAARLPTTPALTYLDSLVPGRSFEFAIQYRRAAVNAAYATAAAGTMTVITQPPAPTSIQGNQASFTYSPLGIGLASGGTTFHFLRIGHSLLALILACAGGFASRSLHDRERRGPAPSTIA